VLSEAFVELQTRAGSRPNIFRETAAFRISKFHWTYSILEFTLERRSDQPWHIVYADHFFSHFDPSPLIHCKLWITTPQAPSKHRYKVTQNVYGRADYARGVEVRHLLRALTQTRRQRLWTSLLFLVPTQSDVAVYRKQMPSM
jgi:hypothetical protein